MSLLTKPGRVVDGRQTKDQKRANAILENAIEKSVMESAQSGRQASSVLVQYLPSVAAEMERIACDPTSSPADKLAAAQVLAKLHSRTVALENGLRRKTIARAEDKGRKARLELRKAEQSERRARKQQKIAEQLRIAEAQILGTGGTNGVI